MSKETPEVDYAVLYREIANHIIDMKRTFDIFGPESEEFRSELVVLSSLVGCNDGKQSNQA